jgi:hypothetical protein
LQRFSFVAGLEFWLQETRPLPPVLHGCTREANVYLSDVFRRLVAAILEEEKESKMHKALKVTLAAAVLAGTAHMVHQANASQTMTGEGGLPLNPTANGIAPGSIESQAIYFDLGSEDGPSGATGPSPSPTPVFTQGNVGTKALPKISPLDRYKFSYYGATAAGRVAKNWEVSGGISHLRVSGDGPYDGLTKTGLNLGVKYLVNPDAPVENIHYAVGAGYDRALLKNWRAYAVASKGFNVKKGRTPIMGHLGVRWDRYSLDDLGGFDGDSSSKVSIFAGTEIPVTRSGDFRLTGEIATRNNSFVQSMFAFAAGVIWGPSSSPFSVAAGIQRQGLIGDEGWYAKIGYSFH